MDFEGKNFETPLPSSMLQENGHTKSVELLVSKTHTHTSPLLLQKGLYIVQQRISICIPTEKRTDINLDLNGGKGTNLWTLRLHSYQDVGVERLWTESLMVPNFLRTYTSNLRSRVVSLHACRRDDTHNHNHPKRRSWVEGESKQPSYLSSVLSLFHCKLLSVCRQNSV